MIVGYHVIFSTYGFWLPNDPRGSWSDFVGSWDLFRYGGATTTAETHSLAYGEHDRAKRIASKKALQYPPVLFNGLQARAVARGFALYAARSGLPVWACSIMPDHVHMVLGRSHLRVEQTVIQLKASATLELEKEGIHPLAKYRREGRRTPKAFARGEWKVFLDPDDVWRNPICGGKSAEGRKEATKVGVCY